MDAGRHDVVVVGGGIAGLAAARALAPDHDVLVLEKGQVAGGATGRASGLVSIVHDWDARPAAARYAIDFFREYDGTGAFAYHRRPNLALVPDWEADEAREQAERLAGAGFDVAYLEPDAVESRYPGVFDLSDFVGAAEYREGGWVDPHTLATTYRRDAEAAGATVETGTAVERVRTESGRVTGVETGRGDVTADAVVLAAGWRTRDLAAPLAALPVRPFRYQTVALETAVDATDYPIAWEHDHHLYWRPERTGDLHVGGSPYFVSDPGTVRTGITASFRDLVAEVLPRCLRGLDDARLSGGASCPTGDAATPDGYPILDAPAGSPDGLVIATGLHGFGIMASPVVGRAVRSLVTGEDAPFPLAPYALSRFDDRSTAFGSDYIAASPRAIR